ncbi:hypothetical protein U3450_003887 [Bacillus cytotoxicus]|uniref:hypothetical protein n=1 Tax=unclassified Bacillus cereus group TaxID=2750818 RepID=UPI001F56C2A5|nr:MULTISPECIES: hypothetical protein [unclassified Bacillus cereus group]EMA6344831.1 hypothetical protein [Bacillus cytotoxicus]
MATFIRLDVKGEWRGTQHRSMRRGIGDDCWCDGECDCIENKSGWESGISCYQLESNHDGLAIEQLRSYWMELAMFRIEDYKDMQLTIFEGDELPGEGSSYEDMANCTKTILEIDAQPFMKKVMETYELYFDEEELTEEQYNEELGNIIANVLEKAGS